MRMTLKEMGQLEKVENFLMVNHKKWSHTKLYGKYYRIINRVLNTISERVINEEKKTTKKGNARARRMFPPSQTIRRYRPRNHAL